MVLNILLAFIAFCFMEFVAWSNHKYVMHGFLWIWHKDHHQNDHKKLSLNYQPVRHFELNDLFFIVYALPAIILLIMGFVSDNKVFISIGVGISTYGMVYFLIHDTLIHERLFSGMSNYLNSRYMRAIMRAHTAHHRPKNKSDFNNYGLLIFRVKYFKE